MGKTCTGVCFCLLGSLAAADSHVNLTRAWAETPGPSHAVVTCDGQPRPLEDILPLLQEPPGEGTPWPGDMPLPLPVGQPADGKTIEDFSAAVGAVEECFNAGDIARYNAHFSDNWFREMAGTEELIAELQSPYSVTPTPFSDGEHSRISQPWHVETLPDGRVLAAVVWLSRAVEFDQDPDRVRVLIFVNQDGSWVIDEILDRVAVPDCELSVHVAAVVGPPPGAILSPWPTQCDAQGR